MFGVLDILIYFAALKSVELVEYPRTQNTVDNKYYERQYKCGYSFEMDLPNFDDFMDVWRPYEFPDTIDAIEILKCEWLNPDGTLLLDFVPMYFISIY